MFTIDAVWLYERTMQSALLTAPDSRIHLFNGGKKTGQQKHKWTAKTTTVSQKKTKNVYCTRAVCELKGIYKV